MAGATMRMSITKEFGESLRTLRGIALRPQDARELAEELGDELVYSVHQRFADQADADGRKWKPSQRALGLAPSRHTRRLGPGQTLVDSGGLRASIHRVATTRDVRVGTDKVYGAIHHFGGVAGRGHRTHLAARAFLGMSRADQEVCLKIVARFIDERRRSA